MKNNIFCWSSDLEDFTGEGLLARCFLKNSFFFKKTVKIISVSGVYLYNQNKLTVIKKKNYNNNFFTKYVSPFIGILLIWWHHLNGKQTCYINYLPLWNVLIFLLLPSKTILGPITGNVFYYKIDSFNSFIRKKIFPILYFLSLQIIFYKYKFYIFSTENLKKYIPKKYEHLCIFNFCLLFFKKRKKKKKNIDIVFYLRDRSTKTVELSKFLIKMLYNSGIKLIVIGDEFKYKNIINYKNISRKKIIKVLDKVSFSFNPGDNFYSLFLLDCISCNQSVFFDNKHNIYKQNIFNTLIPLDYGNFYGSYKKILYYLRRKKKKNLSTNFKKVILNNNIKKIKKKLVILSKSI